MPIKRLETAETAKLRSSPSAALKRSGVEFEGVFCSAEAEDMWSLNSIKDFVAAGNSTPFEFVNGNVLVLTPANLAAFTAVWTPFRASFFV